jgi:TRAP-type C4-dicarboxylate transport system permease small subunit
MLFKLRRVLLTRLRLRESWVVFFILGFIMMNYPFINIFNKPYEVCDIPLLLLYLYCCWATLIIVIYLLVSTINLPEANNDKGAKK